MSDRQPSTGATNRLTRRRVLAAVGGIGSAGLVAGSGTAAYFREEERFGEAITAGTVQITADCDGCTTTDGRLTFDFDGIEPGSGWHDERFELGLPPDSNASRLWLRTTCPPAVDPLGDVLQVRIDREQCHSGSQTTTQLFPNMGSVSLNDFRRALTDGLRLDDPNVGCLEPGETLCLRFRYRLPGDATWAVAATTDLEFGFHARQCRHVDEQVVQSPFGPIACPELDCEACVELGKLDVEGGRLAAGDVYDFDEYYNGFDDRYRLQVLSVTDKSEDGRTETVCASVRLLKDGSERAAPPICRVTVGGGRPGHPPDDPDSRVRTYQVDPPSTRTRGEVCARHGDDDRETVPDYDRPAISNLTVFVCAPATPEEPPETDCAPCKDESGNRAIEATFNYDGPDDDVTVTLVQRGQGNAPQETVTAVGVDVGDSFTLPLSGSGRPDFAVTVTVADTETVLGTVHTSCSQPFGPGLEVTDGSYTVTVVEATAKDGSRICEVNK